MMADKDALGERLEALEKSVRRAAEAIARLRRERETLQARVTQLEGKLAGTEGEKSELQALRQERKDVLAQVDSILKELDKLEL
jgi:predicted  nucleic acid-binding Zn-ribbon protein